MSHSVPLKPTNPLVGPMLTDMYQISMTYGYWKNQRRDDIAVFDLFFRKCPFGGEFCILAGTDEVIRFLSNFRFERSDIEYLQSIMPRCEPAFFAWLETLDCSKIRAYAHREGGIVFPREPLLRIEGPLAVCQLLETTLLNLINFPALIATNASRMRLAAGPEKSLLEFGLRRAQGPDGALSASKYSYVGGFDGTSNVLAGKLFGIGVKGTMAHAYIMSYCNLSELVSQTIASPADPTVELPFVEPVLAMQAQLGFRHTNESELAAFISYAQAFPNMFLALVDTYDTLNSGVPNFITVASVLADLGYKPMGIRLDSGDLAYLSRETRKMFRAAGEKLGPSAAYMEKLAIVASNDINEDVLISLNREGHEIDTFGIGTHLVTCAKQPALGCVYKLVSINEVPRIKLSQEVVKLVIPARKDLFRLYGADGFALLDLMQMADEEAPVVGGRILCRHPFQEAKRAYVTPSKVVRLLDVIWDGPAGVVGTIAPLADARAFRVEELGNLRQDHVRQINPTPYKVSVSEKLYDFMHKLWLSEAPVAELA